MRIISVNVGQPREIETPQGIVLTSIFKSPVERVTARNHNLSGDRQSDLSVHGGPYKAVYAYPHEHYKYWASELPDHKLTPGNFGENLSIEGLTEEQAHIGDQFRIGSAILEVTQPRMPCFKLALRFGRRDMVKRFWRSGRSGFYLSIAQEGELAPGDEIERLTTQPDSVSVADVVRLFKGETDDEDLYQRAMRSSLSGSWKQGIRERLGS